MVVFGLAEVATGFSHHFFGLSTAPIALATYAGASIGFLYAAAGFLILSMKRRAAALAIVLLIAVILGRVSMVLVDLYPVGSFKQGFAILLGTSIVAVFAVYIRSKWSFFS
jgi:hypothetical protein